MEYRNVGRSGLKVSALSLGGWLTIGAAIDTRTAHAIVDSALDKGVNFFDVADGYGGGEAERVLGAILSKRARSQLVLSSKLYWPMSDDPNDRGLSRKHIFESIERTLRNLQTDYLDIYFCHREDSQTPLEETMRAMDDLIRQGKVLYWGTSMWRPKTLQRVYKLAGKYHLYAPVVEQPQYNLIERWIETQVVPTAHKLGMGLVVWSPLAGGVLTGKYNNEIPAGSRGATSQWLNQYLDEHTLEKVNQFCALAKEQSLEPAQLALAWLLKNPNISSLITGSTQVRQLTSNLKAIDVKIPDDLVLAIERLFPHQGKFFALLKKLRAGFN